MTPVRLTVLGVLAAAMLWGCGAHQKDSIEPGSDIPVALSRTPLPDEFYEQLYGDILAVLSSCAHGSADPAICAETEKIFEELKSDEEFIDWFQRKEAEKQAAHDRALLGMFGGY